MYIRTNISALNTSNNLKAINGQKVKATERLSSGLRINRASDDAAGLAISEKMRGQIRGLQQASQNIQDGISLIQTAEGAMQEMHAILQRLNELAVQSSTGTYSDIDRANIQEEKNNLVDELDRVAENTNFNGIKLINGSNSLATDGSYTNIVGSRSLPDLVEINSSNDKFYFNLDTGDYSIALDHGIYSPTELINQINTRLSNNHIDLGASLENGKLKFSHILSGDYPIHAITGNGTRLMLTNQQGSLSEYKVAGEALLSPFVTITAGVNDVLTFEVDGINYSITIQAGTYVTPEGANPSTSPLAKEINNKLSGLNIPIVAGYGGFVGNHPTLPGDVFSACLTFKGNVGHIGSFGGSAKDTLIGNLWYDQSQGGDPASIMGSADLSGGLNIVSGSNDTIEVEVNGVVKAYTFQAGTYDPSSLISELNSQFSADYLLASLVSGRFVLSYNNGAELNITGGNLVKDLLYSYEEGEEEEELSQGIAIQTGTDIDDKLVLDMPYVTVNALKLSGIDLSSVAGASNGSIDIQNAIKKMSTERAKLGAYQNRLEFTNNNVTNYSENIITSESRIRDADMAKSMIELTRSRIIENAGQLMLVQSKTNSQSVLGLLVN